MTNRTTHRAQHLTHCICIAAVLLGACAVVEEDFAPDIDTTQQAATSWGDGEYCTYETCTGTSCAGTPSGDFSCPPSANDLEWMTKRPWDDDCDLPADMYVAVPRSPGPHPLFIYLVGTFADHDTIRAKAIVEIAASRGFVAASLDYANGFPGQCATIDAKATCMVSEGQPESAVQIVGAAFPGAVDASRIAVSGHSQGAAISLRAKNVNPNVKAAVAYSISDHVLLDAAALQCNEEFTTPSRALRDRDLRLVVGDSDHVGAAGVFMSYAALIDGVRDITGKDCGYDTGACIRFDGSGYFNIPSGDDSPLEDGVADHSWMVNKPLDSEGNSTCGLLTGGPLPECELDDAFENGGVFGPGWSLGRNLAFLERRM